MKKFRKLILGAVTAAAAAVMSLCAVPEGVLPELSVVASAITWTRGGEENNPTVITEQCNDLAPVYGKSYGYFVVDNDVTLDTPRWDIGIGTSPQTIYLKINTDKTLKICDSDNKSQIKICNEVTTFYVYGGGTLEVPCGFYTYNNSYIGNIILKNMTLKTNSSEQTFDEDGFLSTSDKYKVSFNSNGGSAVDSQTVGLKFGDTFIKAAKPADPTLEGFVFKGWYDNAACTGTAFDFASTAITADTTLYAKWLKPITYITADDETDTFGDDDEEDYTPVTSDTTSWSGTMVVADDVTISGKVTLSGDTNLILCDGKTLNIGTVDSPISDNCIYASGKSLTVYGQTKDTGTLNAYNTSSPLLNAKYLTVNGGKLSLNAANNNAIYIYNGSMTINRGEVVATSTATSSLSGYNSAVNIYSYNDSDLTVNGGSLTAQNINGYGILGQGQSNATISIDFNGGKLVALGSENNGIKGANVILDYTESTDSFKAGSINSGTVTFADGKCFTDGTGAIYSGTLTDAQKTAIAGKTLTPAYAVTIDDTLHGTVTASPEVFAADGFADLDDEDKTVSVSLTHDTGYQLNTLTVTKASGGTVAVSGTGNTRTFTMPAENVTVSAEFGQIPVSYIDAAGDSATVTDYTLVTSSDTDVKWTAGTYVVADDVTINGQVTLTGDVNLILCDGKKLTVTTPYNRERIVGSGINIFGQSGQTGKLIVSATGGACFSLYGSLNIYGGDIEATTIGSFGMAADEVTIVRGKVNASGYNAIKASRGKIIISGGNVKAVCNSSEDVFCGSLYGYTGVELDWTEPTDSISLTGKIYVHNGKVTIADGKYFTDDAGALYSGELTGEQIAALANNTLYPACKFTIKGNAPVGVRLNDNGTVTPPTAKSGLTIDGWYTDSNCTQKCAEGYFDSAVTDTTEFYGRYVVEYVGADGNAVKLGDDAGENFTLVTSSDTGVTWTAGTYVVADNVEIKGNDDNSPIKANGNINLILCDGKKLTITMTNNGDAGINAINYDLTIYGQSVGSGELSIVSARPAHYGRGIKANNLNFYGGKLSCECTSVGTQNSDYLVPVDANSIIFGWTSPNNSIYIKHIPTGVNTISLSNVPTFVKPYIVQNTNTLVTGSDVDDITKLINGKTIVPAYKVTFDAGDGNFGTDDNEQAITKVYKGVAATGTAKVTAPTAPKHATLFFAGWYTDESCTDGNKFDFSTAITADTPLYAKWVAHRHTLTHYSASSGNCRTLGNIEYWHCSGCEKNFSDSEGNAEITGSVTTDYGSHSYSSKITTPATCTTTGIRTHTCSICGYSYTSTINALNHDYDPETGKCSRCGQYDPAKFLTVTFDSNGGSAVDLQTVELDALAAMPTAPEREGYTFLGWFIGEEKFSFTTPITDNITLTAKWEINRYTVTFVTNCDTALEPVEVEYNKTVAMPDGLAREGYTFVEWQLDGTAYDFATPVTGNITLTAKWKAIEYTVTFVLNGTTHSTAKVEYGKVVTFPEIAVPEDKKFFGWYTDEAMKTLYNATAPVTADITLYAAEKAKADAYINGEPANGTFTDNLKNIKGDNVVITLGEDVEIGKLTFPKAKDAAEIVIDGGGCTVTFTGSAAIKPNQKLTLVNVDITAKKNNKPQNITITSAKGGLTLENVTLNGKKATVTASAGDLTLGNVSGNELNVKGAAKTTMTLNGDMSASVVSGFGTVNVNGTLNVTKTLTVNELKLADNAVLNVAKGATITIKKGISGNGTLHIADGFKSITVNGAITGKIKLVSDKPMADGTLLFKSKITDLSAHFDISGIAPAVTDGEYEYGMYTKSGKVYLRAFKLQSGGKTYCEYSDIISEITKAGKSSESYTINLLDSIDLGSAFKFPTKGKYAGLTINGNGHTITFSGSTITLTGNLKLTYLTLNATATKGCTIKQGKFKLDADGAELVNCIVK